MAFKFNNNDNNGVIREGLNANADLIDTKADSADVTTQLAAKADLVDGLVPEDNLPEVFFSDDDFAGSGTEEDPFTVIGGASITIDDEPTEDSVNAVSSGGVFAALGTKIDSNGVAEAVNTYLQSLAGYTGDGSKVLADDMTWQTLPDSGLTQLDAPELTAGIPTDTTIPLIWTMPVDATGFILQRATNSVFTTRLTTIYTGALEAFTDIGLTAETEYFYRIKAQANGFTDSDYDTISATTDESPSTVQSVQICLAYTGGESTTPNWNSYLKDVLPAPTMPLINSLGDPSGWSLRAQDVYGDETIGSPVIGDPDFPDEVINHQWFNQFDGPMQFYISGLDIAKTYTVLVAGMDNTSGTITSHVTVQSTTQIGTSDDTTLYKLTFNGVVPDGSGVIEIQLLGLDSGDPFPVINGIILREEV